MRAYITDAGIQAECPRTQQTFLAGDVRYPAQLAGRLYVWLRCSCCTPRGATGHERDWHPYQVGERAS